MQSIFRIYAKTSKPSDKYLHKQLLSFGLQPKYQQLLHSFYFNANFKQIFNLSFNSFTVQSLYVQLGHRYPLSTEGGQNEKSVTEFLKKINFKSFMPLNRGIVQNTTLKILIRESSRQLPSQNVMISLFQNYLQKEIIMKQYRKMARKQQFNQLQNYYDIKRIVENKWQFQDIKKQQQLQLQSGKNQNNIKLLEGHGRRLKKSQKQEQIQEQQQKENQLANLFEVPYRPNFLLYIRRNHARLLLKINNQSMHKHGWKKNIGWGPIRQSLAASILYRIGLDEYVKQKKQVILWDPLCGSGTFPLVALSMLKRIKVRSNDLSNFNWSKWPVYNPQYLEHFLSESQQKNKENKVQIFCSDIDSKAVQNAVNNFKQFISLNNDSLATDQEGNQFLKVTPIDSIYQLLKNKIYVGMGDFQKMAQNILISPEKKVTIITNLPYLGQRSKQEHSIKQLNSIYRRFGSLVKKYQSYIQNVFVIVDSDLENRNHFVKVSNNQWRILEYFSNGGIEICMLGWAKNTIGWKQIQVYQERQNKSAISYSTEKQNIVKQFKQEIKQLQNKRYELPKHLGKKQGLRMNKRVLQKKRARYLSAAYQIFAKKRDKNQIFQKFARKNLALRLSQRGKTWKRKNISMIGSDIRGKQQIIKKEFQNRIEEAVKRSQLMKQKKKSKTQKVGKKW